jgi:hypothetical protein
MEMNNPLDLKGLTNDEVREGYRANAKGIELIQSGKRKVSPRDADDWREHLACYTAEMKRRGLSLEGKAA